MSLMELLIIISSDFINKSNDNIIDTLNNMIERLNKIKFDKFILLIIKLIWDVIFYLMI